MHDIERGLKDYVEAAPHIDIDLFVEQLERADHRARMVPGPVVAAAAAATLLVLIGGIAWLLRPGSGEVAEVPEPAPTITVAVTQPPPTQPSPGDGATVPEPTQPEASPYHPEWRSELIFALTDFLEGGAAAQPVSIDPAARPAVDLMRSLVAGYGAEFEPVCGSPGYSYSPNEREEIAAGATVTTEVSCSLNISDDLYGPVSLTIVADADLLFTYGPSGMSVTVMGTDLCLETQPRPDAAEFLTDFAGWASADRANASWWPNDAATPAGSCTSPYPGDGVASVGRRVVGLVHEFLEASPEWPRTEGVEVLKHMGYPVLLAEATYRTVDAYPEALPQISFTTPGPGWRGSVAACYDRLQAVYLEAPHPGGVLIGPTYDTSRRTFATPQEIVSGLESFDSISVETAEAVEAAGFDALHVVARVEADSTYFTRFNLGPGYWTYGESLAEGDDLQVWLIDVPGGPPTMVVAATGSVAADAFFADVDLLVGSLQITPPPSPDGDAGSTGSTFTFRCG